LGVAAVDMGMDKHFYTEGLASDGGAARMQNILTEFIHLINNAFSTRKIFSQPI